MGIPFDRIDAGLNVLIKAYSFGLFSGLSISIALVMIIFYRK